MGNDGMRNRYPGTCYRCGKTVATGEGHFEKWGYDHEKKWPNLNRFEKPTWLTQHLDCAIQHRGTDLHFKFKPRLETDTDSL